MRPWRVAGALAALALLSGVRPVAHSAPPGGTLFRDVLLHDGSGAAARRASVRIASGRIMRIADPSRLAPAPGDTVIDGAGLALAPGFVDTHSHHDDDILKAPDVEAATSQGITTIVVGQDGGSHLPLAPWFDSLRASPAAVNVASYAGHGTARRAVLGEDFRRAATPDETRRMQALLRRELAAGALGLSSGLEYDPGLYATTDELVTLARETARAGGRYISHIRSEDRALWPAVDELLAIGRAARLPVQLSHAKLAMVSLWGRADSLIGLLDRARAEGVDVTLDVYPYDAWQSTLVVLFPERQLHDSAAADFALRELVPPDGLLLTVFSPDSTLAGRTLAEIAAARGTSPTSALLALMRQAYPSGTTAHRVDEMMIGRSMDERDIATLLRWPYANVCSDGAPAGGHPRGWGAYPRVLARYVRERGVLGMEEAIRRMTSLAAEHVGLRDRGRVAAGAPADLVLFDPARIADRATFADPTARSAGIRGVWVNGVLVHDGTRPTGAHPGRVLRRAGR